MARFTYSAKNGIGELVQGTMRCSGRRDALNRLLRKGCHPLSLVPAAHSFWEGKGVISSLFGRVKTADLSIFTRQFSSLLRAGVPVAQVLATLRKQLENKRLIRVVEDMEEMLSQEGKSLSECMDEHPLVFSPVYRSLVRAGEEGGKLVEVLDNLAKHLSQAARLRGQVVGAFIYPIFLLVLGITAIFVLMTFVIPKFQELFDSFGQALPVPTQILISTSGFLAQWWWLVIGGVVFLILGILLLLRREAIRTNVDRRILRLPIVGKMLLKLEVARIAHTLSALVSGGIGILQALRITGQVAHNSWLKSTFGPIVKEVAKGESLADAAEKTKAYPPLMTNLIRTAEGTGELPEMLMELSRIYEEEAERAVTGAVKLLEPILIVSMGGVISAIVAAVMLPIFQANAMVG